MPRTVERTVYKFSELSNSAKEAARSAYRPNNYHDDWWEFVYEYAVECGRLLGINIGTQSFKLWGSKTQENPNINFSGFSSQGDGACFAGMYSCADDPVTAIENHVNADSVLIPIAKELALLQVTTRLINGGALEGRITNSGHYHHSGTMDCTANYVDVENEANSVPEETEEALTALMRRFADWIYSQLEAESNYLGSAEYIDEQLNDNGDEFDEDGSIV